MQLYLHLFWPSHGSYPDHDPFLGFRSSLSQGSGRGYYRVPWNLPVPGTLLLLVSGLSLSKLPDVVSV